MSKLILLRHGASLWNEKNIFTGWVDIPLSSKGIKESFQAGEKISKMPIDIIFTSPLIRAQMTAMLAMSVHEGDRVPCVIHTEGKLKEWAEIYSEEAKKECIPVHTAWQLNERMYGELQGMNKDEMRKKFGEGQVHSWRRSFDIPPPKGESLEMTAARSIPYFQEKIVPLLNQGKNVLISAHGNSLRSIVMFLDKLTKEQVVNLEIATGVPVIYSFEGGLWYKDE
ncbi:MAG TPA: 2,3-bisphosphoglycerate-dependent phosphoglycerate mutase [Rhabdochlamydiaceae bacterium]|jgi:2,3-bisphosphoglycerate-dependent phosphoglycerate mutase|nr:2,3-bisphosphoglycerate-dependent phosphoglycerate mutase [Rhabdochlamydiaceae bacterium]